MEYDAFLTYPSRDRAAAEFLEQWLVHREDLRVFSDEGGFDPELPAIEDHARALRRSRCIVVCFGQDGVERWQSPEARALLERLHMERPCRLIAVLLPGLSPEAQRAIPMYFRRRWWVPVTREGDENAARMLAQVIRKSRGVEHGPALVPSGQGPDESPYRGLLPFAEHDAPIFFGRDAVVQEILLRLPASKFIAVTGPAFIGKTSVLNAGLIPELRGQGWACASCAPDAAPVQSLASTLYNLQLPRIRWKEEELLEHLRDAGSPIVDVLADEILKDLRKARLLLVVDPFEEAFTHAADGERLRFMELLAGAALARGGRVHVVVAMRSEYLGACAQEPALNRLVIRNLIQVGAMSPREARDATLGPAFAQGLAMEPGLADRILEDFRSRPLDLPQFSHALEQLFHRREYRNDQPVLTAAAYHAMGGIAGAVAARAEAAFARIEQIHGPDAHHWVRRILLMHLLRDGGRYVAWRRVAPLSEVLHGDRPRAQSIVEALIEGGILVRTRMPGGTVPGQPVPGLEEGEPGSSPEEGLMIAHDVFLTGWPRLQEWITLHNDDLRAVSALRELAHTWVREGRNPAFVLTGGRLLDAEELGQRLGSDFPPDLAEFVAASVRARDAAERGPLQEALREVRALREDLAARESEIGKLKARIELEAEERAVAEQRARAAADQQERADARARWLGFLFFVALVALAAVLAERFGLLH